MTSIGGNFPSTGMRAAQMFEQLDMPGSVASALGAQIDGALGDVGGVFNNLTNMFTKGIQEDFSKLFGAALPRAHHAPRPFEQLGRAFELGGGGFSRPGIHREAPFGTGHLGRSIERAANQNPLFKGMLERALGGVIVPDGRNDGRLTVYKPPFPTLGGPLADVLGKGLMAASGLAGAIAGLDMAMGPGGPLKSALSRIAGNLANFAQTGGTQGSGGASGSGAASGSGESGGATGQLGPEDEAFAQGMGVDLANASFEDVLFILLMKYAKKKEDDIMKKVKELDKSMQSKEKGGEGGGAGGAGSGGGGGGSVGGGGGSVGGGGGSLGAIGGSLGGVGGSLGAAGGSLGAVSGLAGNALGMLGGAGGAGGGGGVGESGGAGGAGEAGGGGGGGGGGLEGADLGGKMDASKMSDTMKQQMLQKLMGDLQKLYEMLSNMIKSMHDMQMTPTRNLRG